MPERHGSCNRTREDSLRIANDIVLAMRAPFALEAETVVASDSLGIAFYDGRSGIPAEELVKAADRALYQAKAGGQDGLRAAA